MATSRSTQFYHLIRRKKRLDRQLDGVTERTGEQGWQHSERQALEWALDQLSQRFPKPYQHALERLERNNA